MGLDNFNFTLLLIIENDLRNRMNGNIYLKITILGAVIRDVGKLLRKQLV